MADLSIKSILVVRLSSIGDIILTTPLLRSLHAAMPEARIDYVVKEQFTDLVRFHPAIHEVLTYNTAGGISAFHQLLRQIRGRRYDLVLDLHNNPRSFIIAEFGRGRVVRRYHKYILRRQMLRLFRINLLRHAPPVRDRYFGALKGLNIGPDGYGPEMFIGDKAAAAFTQKLADAGVASGRPLIGIAPGASKFTKRWPAGNFVQAGLKLHHELNADVIILGGSGDKEAAEVVETGLSDQVKGKVINLSARLPLLESAAAIQRLSILLCNDTGLMHMATALGTPVAAVFGPTSRELGFFPYGEKARVVEADLDCRPCSLHGDERCPQGHLRCMKEILPDAVLSAARELLALSTKPVT